MHPRNASLPHRHAPRSSTERDPRLDTLALDSLAYALIGAARTCVEVRAGRALPEALAPHLAAARAAGNGGAHEAQQAAGAAGAIQDLAYRTMRRRGTADVLLAIFAHCMPEPPLLRELLCVALTLLVDRLDAEPAGDLAQQSNSRNSGGYADFTVVDQAVRAAVATPELAKAGGLVNAILRKLLRRVESDRAGLRAAIVRDPVARFEHPAWWVARLRRAYPDRWMALLAADNTPGPLTLRVNRRKSSRDDYLARLTAEGIVAAALGPVAVRLDRPRPVALIPGFAAGVVSVQDEAAQRAATSLDVHDGMRVLDACAAPGGKTGHLLELAALDLVALDSDALRLERVRDNLARLGLMAQLVVGDAAHPAGWWDGVGFDRILADVPCTASGVVRRHPDIRWLRQEADILRLSRTAQQITDALWSLLNPDGKLLLVTCSIFPDESARHAEAFAARHPDAAVLPALGQLLPAIGPDEGHDGLFFALFAKTRCRVAAKTR